ncbi:MAG: hypothetical protein NZ805_02335 [Armatimonadetes bacterium]|nr:hypothetical protein [Armatimonadota bacterium]MDW8027061.1 hypothetical protein [Armatimonadota bacterium]
MLMISLSRKFQCSLLLISLLAIFPSIHIAQIMPVPLPPPGELILSPYGKLVVFVMDGLSYRHVLPHGLSAFGEIGKWLEQNGSMALLNTMGYGGNDRFRSAMTIACGVRAFADESAAFVLQANEPFDSDNAWNAYRRRTGNLSLPHACKPFETLVFPMLTELNWRNERLQKKPVPFGVVAQSLLQHGIRIIGIGCGDLPAIQIQQATLSPFRHGLLFALDEKGLGTGLTERELLYKDPTMPYGLAINANLWRKKVFQAWQVANVIVLFPGETFRADLYGSERLISVAIRRELSLLRPVVERINLKRDLLVVFSLAPSQRNRYELSFLCAIGKGIHQNGLLTSLTTHQFGLVSILDIPATILDFFGFKPLQPINGSPIKSVPKSLDKVKLWQMGAKAQATDTYMRTIVLVSWCILQVIVFGSIAFFALQRNLSAALLNEVIVLLIFLTAGLHLITGLMLLPALLTAIAVAIFFGVAKAKEKGLNKVLAMAIIFATAVFIADATRLLPLSVDSPFGYSTFFGGRYYGQGNVSMGLTLGAIFTLSIAFNLQRWATAGSIFVGSILVGAPFFGANIGGALTGFIAALTSLLAGRVRWWHLLASVLAIAAFLFGFAAFELFRPEPLTHLGRFIHDLAKEGFSAIASMVWTKLGISFRAFRAIHWDIAFFAQLFLLGILWRMMGGKDWRLITLLIGAIAALLLNDSGPQTPVAFMFFPLCFLCQKSLFALGCQPSRKPLSQS